MTLTEDTGTAAVTEVVARLQHAQQHELVEEFVALFRADAIWTTGGGRRLVGPDVAAVHARQRTVGPDGEPVAGAPEGSPTYVMTEEGGRWLLAACQNTLVAG